jgi:colanic acid/amylovoran biosynthesis glycosyltransferase
MLSHGPSSSSRHGGDAGLHVAYVLNEFGVTSETFIYEEITSLLEAGITVSVFHGRRRTDAAEHALVRRLGEQLSCLPMAAHRRLDQLGALLAWLWEAPRRTLRVLAQALRSPQRWIYLAALQPAWHAKRLGCARFHAHFADENALHARAMAAWCGMPFGLTLHRYDLFEPVLEHETLRTLMAQAAPLVTISDFNRRHLVNHYGIPFDHIALVRCGIDLRRYTYRYPTREAGTPHVLLSVGRLVPEKAYEQLIEAMALLKADGRWVRLKLVGAGPQEQALREQVRRLGLEAELEFLGARTSEEVIALHRGAHVFVSSSRAEGLPVVCIEALALGTPTVATAIYGVPELIEHEHSGLLVAPESPRELAEALARCLDDEALRQRLSQAGRKRVEQHFERGRCTQALLGHWQVPACADPAGALRA